MGLEYCLPPRSWEGLLSPKAYLVAAAVAFLIAGSAKASVEVEDTGPSAAAFPDGDSPHGSDVFRDGRAFGDDWTTLTLRTSRGNVTSLTRSERFISSLGVDVTTPFGDQNDAGPDHELNADYSESTLEGTDFPTTVNDLGSVDSLIQSGWMLFGDGDHAPGFNFFVPELSGPSNLNMFAENGPKRRGQCSSPGLSRINCETDDVGFVKENSDAEPEAASQFGNQSSKPAVPNAPIGAGYLRRAQIWELAMIAAENSFVMSWPSGAVQGTFPPGCCDTTPSLASTSDFVGTGWNSNLDSPSGTSGGAPLPPAVPEISQWAMMLIGFGGLALLGQRRLRRSARRGDGDTEPGAI